VVYKFDPTYFNGTIFSLDDTGRMERGWMQYERKNQPIPASFSENSDLRSGQRGTARHVSHGEG
jgi:hypothetical protein